MWLHVLGASWTRLHQELPFVGRTGERGDDAGSRVIVARLVRDLMHLAFLVERRWMPYPKWAGTALGLLPSADSLRQPLDSALGVTDWPSREDALVAAINVVAARQGACGLPVGVDPVVPFHGRPFRTVNPRIAELLRAEVSDATLRRLPPGIGAIEQWIDNADVLSRPSRRAAVLDTYRALLA